MESSSRDDIRKLLKTFGVKADELVIAHLARSGWSEPMRLALILEDRTDYSGSPPPQALHLEMEGEIRPG
ncbi:MAG TPA: hypothetical protein VLL77_14305 [Anaerolineales bacterium]|nr:hypothetical protein [Anaerolineales bacterium]